MRSRRSSILSTVVLTALAVSGTGLSASADTGGVPHFDKRVCVQAAAGNAACSAHVATDGSLRPLATTSYANGYAPAQLRKAYGLTGLSATSTVAIVDAYAHPNAAADLAVYRNQFGLGTATLTQMSQTGASITTVTGDTGWGQEEMLDLEMVSATCPTCHILYVGANSSSFSDLAAAVNRAAANGATVISNSYGGNESSGDASIAASYNHPGIAITVSSGDSGYGAQSPAAFKTVTAVGGTSLTLNADGSRANETAWSGAGSGCSAYVSKPTWQKDTGCPRRSIADVAAVADPATGVAVYDSYGSTGGADWFVFGGTSVAAPLIGGVYALSGNTAGVPASQAYTAPAGSLFDVISGSNGRCTRGKNTSQAYLCTAGVGYDGPTGMGTPNGTGAF